MAVHAEFVDVKDMSDLEQQVVSQFAKLSSLADRRHHHHHLLSACVRRQLDDLRCALEPLGLGVQLIHMRHAASIAVFFLLMAATHLHQFADLYATGRLRSVLDSVFSCLSDNGLRLVISRLVCHDAGLSEQRKHFEILQGITQHIDILRTHFVVRQRSI